MLTDGGGSQCYISNRKFVFFNLLILKPQFKGQALCDIVMIATKLIRKTFSQQTMKATVKRVTMFNSPKCNPKEIASKIAKIWLAKQFWINLRVKLSGCSRQAKRKISDTHGTVRVVRPLGSFTEAIGSVLLANPSS